MAMHAESHYCALAAQDAHQPLEAHAYPGEICALPGRRGPEHRLLAHAHRSRYQPQEILYHQGDRADTAYFIVSGLLKFVAYLPNGRSRIVRLQRAGAALGLAGVQAKTYRHAAVAVTPVTALKVPFNLLQRVRRDDPQTYISLLEDWDDYLQDAADTWITDFSTGPIRGRVARLLNYLWTLEAQANPDRLHLLTCEEMGSMLGVTSESVSRTLAEFKRQRILTRADAPGDDCYQADIECLRAIGAQE